MLDIQSDITKYHCLHSLGVGAFQTPGIDLFSLTHPVVLWSASCLFVFVCFQFFLSGLVRISSY